MSVSTKTPGLGPALFAAGLVAVLACGACRDEDRPLRLADLTPTETQYLTRLVTLERARAVALADREAGGALLDSLAADWGEGALEETLACLPAEAKRQEKLHTLLAEILRVELDSLLVAPLARRLHDPLIDPPLPDPPADAKPEA